MDMKEKLVELLDIIIQPGQKTLGDIADHLITNGVTVQEWVSVDERLPENFISVLGYMTDAGEFPPVRECYTVGNAFFFPALGDVHPVSHWCEMPQPPKGETIYCKDCENLMFSDCYGECAKGHKGIVNPNDTCEHAKRKPPKGE